MKIILISLTFLSLSLNLFGDVKWKNPSHISCTLNGGKINDYGICEAKWENAKKICRSSGGFLPSIEAFQKVVTSCGGVVNSDDYAPYEIFEKNKKNLSYQDCYKKIGFVGNFYWSSTIDEKFKMFKAAWHINFLNGYDNRHDIHRNQNVRCIEIDK